MYYKEVPRFRPVIPKAIQILTDGIGIIRIVKVWDQFSWAPGSLFS